MFQLPSAPIEAVRTINIRFNIYIGISKIQLFSKNRMHRVLELELEQTNNNGAIF